MHEGREEGTDFHVCTGMAHGAEVHRKEGNISAEQLNAHLLLYVSVHPLFVSRYFTLKMPVATAGNQKERAEGLSS